MIVDFYFIVNVLCCIAKVVCPSISVLHNHVCRMSEEQTRIYLMIIDDFTYFSIKPYAVGSDSD